MNTRTTCLEESVEKITSVVCLYVFGGRFTPSKSTFSKDTVLWMSSLSFNGKENELKWQLNTSIKMNYKNYYCGYVEGEEGK